MEQIRPLESAQEKNIFRLLRIARNLKVKDVADRLSVSPAYINAIEKGEKYPSKRLLRDYTTVLNVDEGIIETFNPENINGGRFENVLLTVLKMIVESDAE